MKSLTTIVLLAALAEAAQGQAFGRFGYTHTPRQSGIVVDRDGFSSDYVSADKFSFAKPSKIWQTVSTSAYGQEILLSGEGAGLPLKIKMNLLAPGPEFFFGSGMQFDIASTGAPYLSWAEGSVGPDIPTPDASWVLVSFKTSQPPILLCFRPAKTSLTLTGKPGAWHLSSPKSFDGWVRAVLPFGTVGMEAGGASALGQQTQRLAKSINFWQQPPAQLVRFAVKGNQDWVSATWTFDQPGAMVPVAALLAPAGGYPLQINSGYKALEGETPEGPRAAIIGKSLIMQFPIRGIPNGRPLGLGSISLAAPGTVSPIDIPSVADLAVSLLCDPEPSIRQLADETATTFLSEAEYVPEPCSGQRLPYSADGRGLDLAAAQALLRQALMFGVQPPSDNNPLLTSLTWRRDWSSWGFDGANERSSRRAAAIAAVAGALSPEANRRLDAAMLEAGLAAQRARDRALGAAAPTRIEPFASLRATLFGDLPGRDLFGEVLLSHTRIFGDTKAALQPDRQGLVLTWKADDTKPQTLTIVSPYDLQFEPGNLKSLDVNSTFGTYCLIATPKATGRVEVRVTLPGGLLPFPAATPPTPYSEPANLR